MARPRFLDTNVFIRHLLYDHPDHSPRSTLCFDRIEHGGLRVRVTDTVIFETVFTMEKFYRQPRSLIRDNVLPLVELPGVVLPGKRRLRRTFALYVDTSLSFADCYHVATSEILRLPAFISFDRGLDRVLGLQRMEP